MKLAPDYLERITLRSIQDALTQGTRAHWLRRADELEAARPRPGEFYGRATPEQLNARWRRLTLEAEQCRVHAEVFDHYDISLELVAELLGWPAADAVAEAITGEEVAA